MLTAKSSTIENIEILDLPKVETENGNISSLNNSIEIPFDIKRVYYLYDIPSGENRGGHAHKELQQLIIAASGSFDIIIYDGRDYKTINLSRPNKGLLMPFGLWREIGNFSSGSICLVLASMEYIESDYIRDINDYIKYKSDEI